METNLVVPQTSGKPKKSFIRRWMWFCVFLTLTFLALAGIFYYPAPKLSGFFVFAFTGGLVLIPFSGILWICFVYLKAMNQSMKVAFAPIPTPAEIGWGLSQEWGRPATVEEVNAVHQMLTSQHNQAMLQTGIGFAGIYAANRLAEGKPVL